MTSIDERDDDLARLIVRHDEAMRNGRAEEALWLRGSMRALGWEIAEAAGAGGWKIAAGKARAPEGRAPLWGEAGQWLVDFGAFEAVVRTDGALGLAAGASYWMDLDIEACDRSAPFLTETGFLSLTAFVADGERKACASPSAFAIGSVRRYAEARLGGGLVRISQEAAPRRGHVAPPPSAPERTVSVPGTRVRWTGVAGWVEAVIGLGRHQRPSSEFYARSTALHRSLDRSDIRSCRDRQALADVDKLLSQLQAFGLLHGPLRSMSAEEIGSLRVEVHNRLRVIDSGRLDQPPREKGPRLDPARLPAERLDHLIQHHRDMTVVEALRAEKRRRETGGIAA